MAGVGRGCGGGAGPACRRPGGWGRACPLCVALPAVAGSDVGLRVVCAGGALGWVCAAGVWACLVWVDAVSRCWAAGGGGGVLLGWVGGGCMALLSYWVLFKLARPSALCLLCLAAGGALLCLLRGGGGAGGA